MGKNMGYQYLPRGDEFEMGLNMPFESNHNPLLRMVARIF